MANETPVTQEQVQQMIDAAIKAHVATAHAAPAVNVQTAAATPQAPIDPKYLEGLVYRYSVPRKGKPDEGDATIHDKKERPVTPEDVLSWRDLGTAVTFVVGDGQRYTVDKQPKAPAADAAKK